MHRKVAAALLAVLALGVASCGSSETTVTRAQLVSRIESACRVAERTAQQQLKAPARRSGAALAEALAKYQRYVLARVEHVKVSDAAAQSDLSAVKQAARERLAIVERARASGMSGQTAIGALARQTEVVTRRLQAALRGLGAEGCP